MSNEAPLAVQIARRGLMLVLSSPSGAGKTTLSRRLLQLDPGITMSVSVTTRAPRPKEIDGQDYHFIDKPRFDELVRRNALLEHARVFDHHYGTPAAPVEAALDGGRDVLFDIDWQGTQQLSQSAAKDLVRVFILPPTTGELERRLRGRAEDPPAVVARRMAKANAEISHWAEYDYVLINDDVERCLAEVHAILRAERLKRVRQTGLVGFVHTLVGEG